VTDVDPKLSRLYREVSTEGPPAVLDAVILGAARRQVAKPRRSRRSSWSRWMIPISAMATLVLGVSIALLVEREQPVTGADILIAQNASRPQSRPPARAAEPATANGAGSEVPEMADRKEAQAAAAPAQAPAAGAPAQAPVLQFAEPAPTEAQTFPAEKRSKAVVRKSMTDSNVAGDSGSAGLGAAPPAATDAADRLAPKRQLAMQRSPEAWLEEIRRLKREGREKDAAEQLAEFRKVYPAYELPEYLLR